MENESRLLPLNVSLSISVLVINSIHYIVSNMINHDEFMPLFML